MKLSEVTEIVMTLLAAYPNRDMSAHTSDVYERSLRDLDRDVAHAAVERLIRTCRFLPSIAEIREACEVTQHGHRRTGEEAWADAMKAVRYVGQYRPMPRFRDPIVTEALKLWGSWEDFASCDHSAADRARFIQLYDELAKRTREQAVAGSLPTGGGLKRIK
jgi:hypothetical protein